jgi:hypothetical protein
MMARRPSPQPNYHLVGINQSCTLTRWNRVWREWQCHPQAKGEALALYTLLYTGIPKRQEKPCKSIVHGGTERTVQRFIECAAAS